MLWSFERPVHSEGRPMLNAQLSAKETLGDRSGASAAGWFAAIRDPASATGTSCLNGHGCSFAPRRIATTGPLAPTTYPSPGRRFVRALVKTPQVRRLTGAVSSGKSSHDAFAGATNSLVYVRCRSICLPLIAGLIVDRTLRTFSGPPAGILPSGVYIAMVDFSACT